MDEYLTVKQAAEKLDVSADTLRRWDKSGKFPSTRHPINNYRVYATEQVETFVNDLKNNFTNGVSHTKGDQKKYTPYFSTSLGTLFNLDAVDFLKSIDTGSVDLIFA